MQLSASTTPTDPKLAAFFATTGASLPTDSLTGAATQPGAFAELLSGATPASTPAIAVAPDLGIAIAGPTAATTIANFPSWLAADATPTPAPAVGASLIPVNGLPSNPATTVPSIPGGNSSATIPSGNPTGNSLENETMNGAPVVGRPGHSTSSHHKTGRAAKSATGRTDSTDTTATPLVPMIDPAVVPAVVAPGVTLTLPGVGDSNPRSSLDENGAAAESETADENENLPAAITPVSSRKEGKSSASPRWLISEEDEDATPAPAPVAAQTDVARFQLNAPAFAAAPAPATPNGSPADSVTDEKPAPLFAGTSASRRSTSGPAVAAPLLATTNRRAPIQPEFEEPDVSSAAKNGVPVEAAPNSSFSVPASMRPVSSASHEIAFQSASELSAEPVRESIASSSPIAQASKREQPVDDAPSLIQFEKAIPTRAEIFAAIDGNIAAEKKSAPGAADKTFLSSALKRVTTRDPGLGTGIAKSAPVMPTTTLPDRPTLAAPLERAFEAQGAAASASAGGMLNAEPAAVAHRAVDAVMTAVERYSSGDRHSVQLQFSVGGADLSVRVELRGDEVRTTFRTDSPELRNALAHEWQAASANHSDARDVRIAQPVFSAGNNSNFSSFSGDTSSRQRDAQSQRGEADELFSAVAARSRTTPAFSSALDDLGTAAARVTAPATALHLSTHA